MHFLFYDIETSGLSPAFDQVLTFACIKTDADLVELSREVITVKLRPDIVPSPAAFLTHGLTPEELDAGIPEYQAALKIHRLFNTPETISLGYNSLGFDDEFLRFLFYRNLLDPYSHQYANGCGRMDLLPVAAVYRVFCGNILSWPMLENGKSTLKLEHISRENRFQVSGRAHEAMADVEALLCMARIFQKEKKVWEYLLGFFDKQTDNQRIQELKSQNPAVNSQFKIGLMVSVSFGADRNYMAPVIHLGQSEPYKNQSLWLRLDKPDLLAEMDEENGIYNVFITRKRPGDQFFILPCLDRFWGRLNPEAAAACKDNLDRIHGDDGCFLKTAAYHRAYRYPDIPDVDPDADLYQGGFFSPFEKKEIASFHQALSREKDHSSLYQICRAFKSRRVSVLAARILARSFGAPLSGNAELSAHIKRLSGDGDAVKGYKNDEKFTCDSALVQVENIQSGIDTGEAEPLDKRQKAQLAWLKSHINKMSAFLADSF
ncbi:MAG: exodeoxyribonuclease I [Desulfobacter sp.]|nr:MAG: exodeoxyribonuclease I [Desulfobacter sp.]